MIVVDKEDTNLEMYFDECVDFIDEAKRQGGSVLVHCFVGKSRRSVLFASLDIQRFSPCLLDSIQN